MTRETRAVQLDRAEVRKADDAGALKFIGHAAVFNERTWIGPKRWGFWEEVAEGFFDDVLDDADARFLINHDPNLLLARNGKTMTLATDARGLLADADWDAADPDASKWAGRVRRGDADQMSFAFTVAEEKWSEDEAGNEIRTLLKADRLYDVSLVTYPAYEGTDGAMREAEAAEVVKRHRGYDPRTATPRGKGAVDADVSELAKQLLAALRSEAGEVVVTAPPAEPTPAKPVPNPDPPVVDVPLNPEPGTPDPVVEPADDDEPTSDEAAHARALERFTAQSKYGHPAV